MNNRGILNTEQNATLLKPITKGRVGHKQGQSHVEAYDIRAHLIRMFGFGNWDFEMIDTELLFDQNRQLKNGKDGCYVAYRVTIRLTVRNAEGLEVARYDGTAVGSATQPDYMRADAHDMAVKTAESQALKRAAINLGDQFGLSLYNGGSINALVRKVVVDGDDDSVELPDIAPEGHDVIMPRTDDDDLALERMADPEPVQAELTEALPAPDTIMVSDAQIRKMQTQFGVKGMKDRAKKLEYISSVVGRTIGSSKELTMDEATRVIERLEQ